MNCSINDIRRDVRIRVFCFLALLGNAINVPACLGDDEAPHNIVLRKSFVTPLEASFPYPLAIHKVGFSKDGQMLACFCSAPGSPNVGDVYLWDVKTGKFVRRIRPLFEWKGVVLRPGGLIEFPFYFTTVPHARLCFRTTTGLEVQDDFAGSTKRPIRLKRLDGSAKIEPGGIYFSTDDRYLAALRRDDRSVNVWDVKSGDRIGRFVLPDFNTTSVRSVAFDPTNHYLAVGIDHYVGPNINGATIVWDLRSGELVFQSDDEFRIFQVAFRGNGDLICGGGDRLLESGTITIRKAGAFDDAPRTFHTPSGVRSIAIVPNIGLITGDWHGQVLLWDIAMGRLLAVAKENGQHVGSLAMGQNGKALASGDWDSIARLWRIAPADRPAAER